MAAARINRWTTISFIAGATLCGVTQRVRAQQRTGTIVGTVRDSLHDAIIGAQVSVGDGRIRTVTSQAGEYKLTDVPVGTVTISARRLGFRPGTINVAVNDANEAHGDFVLGHAAHMLSTVAVQAAQRQPQDQRLAGFTARSQHPGGGGRFITRDQIDVNPNFRLIDALRRMPGTRVVNLRGAAGRSVVLGGANCPPTVFVDGFAASLGSVDLDMFDLSTTEGVEVYSGSSSIPPELLPSQGQERCGVIAIWGRAARMRRSSRDVVNAADVQELAQKGAVLTADQVEVQVVYEEGSATPIYPPEMLKAKTAGRVILEFVVDANGRVDLATIGVVSGTNAEFVNAARAALPQARFEPATVGGRSVRQLVQAPFDFNP
jgi:TonB family protein